MGDFLFQPTLLIKTIMAGGGRVQIKGGTQAKVAMASHDAEADALTLVSCSDPLLE